MNITKTLLLAAGILVPTDLVLEARGNVTLVTLVRFDFYGTNGYSPQGALVPGDDGNFYGTTHSGGLNYGGTAFRMSPDGEFTSLCSFPSNSWPRGTLVHAADGNFYGTTVSGGTNYQGIVFQITPKGAFASLASLAKSSVGGLIQGSDGNLYGTTYWDGTNTGGSIFRISTNGTLATITSLGNAAHPQAALVQAADGNFYGTTIGGGDYGLGSIFQMTPAGTLTTVASFNGTNGSYPQTALIQAADGNFYGTATEGGIYSYGTAFRMTLQGLNGTITPLVSFDYTNGARPMAKLIQATDGYFYGTTAIGGLGGNGTIFRLATNGTMTTLYSFFGSADGFQPCTELTQSASGDFYGTTGGSGWTGTIFIFNPNWPVILTQPLSGIYTSGSTATFTISADGPGLLSYRWQKDGTNLNNGGNISGVTTTNLTISGVSASDAGTYTAIVRNAFGTVSSAGAVLTLATVPVITTPPESQTNFYGWTSTFAVSANGIPSPTYQWQRNGTNLADNSYISGSTNATLTLRAITYADAAIYSVVISNAAGTVTSSDVTLVVTNDLVQNGSFETGDFSGWSLSGAVNNTGVTPSFAHSGKYSAQLSNPAGGVGHLYQVIPTTPGTAYLLSFWLRNIYTGANKFSVAWNTNANTTNIVFDQVNIGPVYWPQFQFVVTATETSTILDFAFSLDFKLDDVLVLPVVPADSPPPTLSTPFLLPGSGTQLQIRVNAGNSYQLQASSNLVDWVTLTNFLPFSGSVQIYDPQATNLPARFYRVISP